MTALKTASTGLGFTEEQPSSPTSCASSPTPSSRRRRTSTTSAHSFPYEIVAQMGELGLFGLPFPRSTAARAATTSSCASRSSSSAASTSRSRSPSRPASDSGRCRSCRRHRGAEAGVAAELAAGAALAGFGLTEPEAGSDAGATRTTAVLDGGEWVINGSKQFITNSGTDITRLVTSRRSPGEMTARQDESSRRSSCRAARPGSGRAGLRQGRLEHVRHASAHVPGRPGARGEPARRARPRVRELPQSARRGPRRDRRALRPAPPRAASSRPCDYAKTRNVFGSAIGSNQHIAFMLARMQVRVHTARLATYDAARGSTPASRSRPRRASRSSSASEAAMDNARDATQIFGGYGFMNETPSPATTVTRRSSRSARAPPKCSSWSSRASSDSDGGTWMTRHRRARDRAARTLVRGVRGRSACTCTGRGAPIDGGRQRAVHDAHHEHAGAASGRARGRRPSRSGSGS